MSSGRRVDIQQTLSGVSYATRRLFIDFHKANPDVWKQFERFALEACRLGLKYSAKAIMERVRWHCEVENNQEFKVNNNFTAYYARIFAAKYPEHSKIFEFREVKGLKAA